MALTAAVLTGVATGAVLGALATAALFRGDDVAWGRELARLSEVRHRARLTLRAWDDDDATELVTRMRELRRALEGDGTR